MALADDTLLGLWASTTPTKREKLRRVRSVSRVDSLAGERRGPEASDQGSRRVGLAGIEPATSALSVLRSNRLSYSPSQVNNLFKDTIFPRHSSGLSSPCAPCATSH